MKLNRELLVDLTIDACIVGLALTTDNIWIWTLSLALLAAYQILALWHIRRTKP